jgi:hypothetical protein
MSKGDNRCAQYGLTAHAATKYSIPSGLQFVGERPAYECTGLARGFLPSTNVLLFVSHP